MEYKQTGIPGEREHIRMRHGYYWRSFKKIIDPEMRTQLHHEWIEGTSEYRGVALVERDQHMRGFVDVIRILQGKITLEGNIKK